MVTTPVTIKRERKSTIHVMLHTRKAHDMPGYATSSLLSVGQLVDANCYVLFDKMKIKVLLNNISVLEGQSNFIAGGRPTEVKP
jgi:hypothetical protein